MMDIIALDAFLASSFFLDFAVSFLANETAQAAKRFIKRTFKKENLDDQLVDALNDSLKKTCKQLNIQYQEGVTLNEFIASIANRGEITTKTLRKILEDVVEIQDSDRFMDAWIIEFEKAVAHPEREWLRNFLLMQNIIVDDRLKTDNARYADNFEEVMFLHTEAEHKVRLCDLYIPPNRVVGQNKKTVSKAEKVITYIESFIESNSFDALILEGDAGVGKTSFVSYLAHMYLKKTKEWAYHFGARELISIRLRDLIPDSGSFSKKLICNDVLKYLNVEMKLKNQFKDEHKDAVVILDGFDELCMIEGIEEHQGYYIKELCRLFDKCRFIITTRPHYLKVDELVKKDIHCDFVMLGHFGYDQRVKWVNKYREATHVVDEEETTVLNYILSIDDDKVRGICDTPMILYMMVRGRINEEARENIWALYHQIFHKEITETEYNKIFPSEYGDTHPIEEYSEELYRLNAEIAYKMYQSNNNITYLSNKDIDEILDEMNFSNRDENVNKIIKSCYALCSYWKNTSDKGVVEFYHNNIRDFFMCEKIFLLLNKLYEQEKPSSEEISDLFIYQFGNMKISDTILTFLYHRIVYEKERSEKRNFMKYELGYHLVGACLERSMRKSIREKIFKIIIFKDIEIVIKNIIKTYRVAYEPYLNTTSYIPWTINRGFKVASLQIEQKENFLPIFFSRLFSSEVCIGEETIKIAYRGLFENLYFSHLSFIDFKSDNLKFFGCTFFAVSFEHTKCESIVFLYCNFYKCSFTKAELERAQFFGCDIRSCSFEKANLKYASFEHGGLFYENSLDKANLEEVSFEEANLEEATFRKQHFNTCSFKKAKVLRCRLSECKKNNNIFNAFFSIRNNPQKQGKYKSISRINKRK